MSDFTTRLQEASLLNSELLRGLQETDYAGPTLKEHSRYVKELQTLAQKSDKKLKQLEVKRRTELRDHEKYRDSHVKRFMYKATGQKDKFAQKAEKEEREYFEVLQEQQKESRVNENVRSQLQDATKHQAALERQVQRHQELQSQLDALYQDLFSGPTPQFPEEDEKERQSLQMLGLYDDTRTKYEAESRAAKLLASAQASLRQSMVYMREAQSHSRVDMFGGGAMWDMMERSALSRAENFLQEGRREAMQAQQASPLVHPLPAVNINHGNLMSDVFFDNIFTDMAFHEEIKRGMRELEGCIVALNRELLAAKTRSAELQRQLTLRERDLETARVELQKARERAFERTAQNEDPSPPYQAQPV